MLAAGILTREIIESELDRTDMRSSRLAKALQGCNFPGEEDLIRVIARSIRVPGVKLESVRVNKEVVGLVSQEHAQKFKMVAIDRIGDILFVLTPDVGNVEAFAAFRRETGCFLAPIRCPEEGFLEALPEFYADAILAPARGGPASGSGSSAAAGGGDPEALAALPVESQELVGAVALQGYFVDVVDAFEHTFAQGGPILAEILAEVDEA